MSRYQPCSLNSENQAPRLLINYVLALEKHEDTPEYYPHHAPAIC
jgi:hypothetical protein